MHRNASEYIVCKMAAILSRGDELKVWSIFYLARPIGLVCSRLLCAISHSTIRPCYDDTQLYCVHQKSEIMTQVQWSYIDALISPSLVWLRNWTFLIPQQPQQMPWGHTALDQIDALVQEGRNSIASAMELRLSCTNLSIWHLPKLVCL